MSSNYKTLLDLVGTSKLKIVFLFSVPRARSQAFQIALVQSPEIDGQVNSPLYNNDMHSIPHAGLDSNLRSFELCCERIIKRYADLKCNSTKETVVLLVHEHFNNITQNEMRYLAELSEDFIVLLRHPRLQLQSYMLRILNDKLLYLWSQELNIQDILTIITIMENVNTSTSEDLLLQLQSTTNFKLSKSTVVNSKLSESIQFQKLVQVYNAAMHTMHTETACIWYNYVYHMRYLLMLRQSRHCNATVGKAMNLVLVDSNELIQSPENILNNVCSQISGMTYTPSMINNWTKCCGSDFYCSHMTEKNIDIHDNAWLGPSRGSKGLTKENDCSTAGGIETNQFPVVLQSVVDYSVAMYNLSFSNEMKEYLSNPCICDETFVKDQEIEELIVQSDIYVGRGIPSSLFPRVISPMVELELPIDVPASLVSANQQLLLEGICLGSSVCSMGGVCYELTDIVNVDVGFQDLENACCVAIQKHSELRSVFIYEETEYVRYVCKLKQFKLCVHTLATTVLTDADFKSAVDCYAQKLCSIPVDMSTGPLFRIHLLKTVDRCCLVIAVHHVLGFEVNNMLNELLQCCAPNKCLKFMEIVATSGNVCSMNDNVMQERQSYWYSRLGKCSGEFSLFGSSANTTCSPGVNDHALGSIVLQEGKLRSTDSFILDADTCNQLDQFLNTNSTFEKQDVFLFIYIILLYRYCQQEELLVFCQNASSDFIFHTNSPTKDESARSWLDSISKLYKSDTSNCLSVNELVKCLNARTGANVIQMLKQSPMFHYYEHSYGLWSTQAFYVSSLGIDISSKFIFLLSNLLIY